METTLLQAALLLAAFLVLVMYRFFQDGTSEGPPSFWPTLGCLLLFSQALALVFALFGDAEGVWDMSLTFNLMAAGGYVALFQVQRLAARRLWSFATAQLAEFGALLLGAAAGAVAANVIAHHTMAQTYLWDLSGLFGFLNLFWMAALLSATLLIASVRMFYNFRLHLERQARGRQAFELLQLREQHVAAQLESIQARINPHFLYNALNSIADLVHEDAARAEEMTLALSRLFRAALEGQEDRYTTVRREAALVETYLAIEQVRYGDRLQYHLDVDPAVADARIPRFLLQPLVENAVQHGAARQPGQGRVALEVRPHEGGLSIAIKDNGPDFPADLMGGFGWQSVQDSLALLYPNAHDIRLVNGRDKQVHITLRKPA